jgi:uncharacterized protein
MILKLIMIGVVLIAIYKFIGGSFALPTQGKEPQEGDADALEECSTCGTYVTRKESIQLKGSYYCSKECIPS